MIAPPRLRPGDRVGIVAPASPVRRGPLLAGARALAHAGFRVVMGRHVLARRGHLAGSDEARAADLNRMLRDPDIRCILMARGGYGAMRLARMLDWGAMKRDPKVFAGFSDATFLHLGFAARSGVRTLHGPNLQGFARPSGRALPRWIEWLTQPRPSAGTRSLGAGRQVAGPGLPIRGRVMGGNLVLLACAAGTDFLPSLRGAILVLEEVGEGPYRIDRMLTHLALSGALRGVAGVALGSMKGCSARPGFPQLPLREVLRDRLAQLGVPVRAGLPVGHGARNLPFPHGARAVLDPGRRRLVFEEGLVS
ncbi:MAG TPA: LD-carboxypeptidase [Candidatus Eisenbacteria bacterium]|jgi:muramoyltetrapeptide carboxypeptidase